MKNRFQLTDCRTLEVDMAEPGARRRTEHYSIFEFVPRQAANQDDGVGNRVGVDQPVSPALELTRVCRPLLSP